METTNMTADYLKNLATDEEIDTLYDCKRSGALGEAVGSDDDTPREAAEREGWTVLRTWNSRTIQGSNVLAEDTLGAIWGIVDDNGPWGIELAGFEWADQNVSR